MFFTILLMAEESYTYIFKYFGDTHICSYAKSTERSESYSTFFTQDCNCNRENFNSFQKLFSVGMKITYKNISILFCIR